ncbi:MAG: MarR family transcriptional regulator [Phycisphaerae bacterium]|nr:MarR family transcriptional regulator [Phycisphaerae bacterium]
MSDQPNPDQIQQMAEQIFELIVLSYIPPASAAGADKWELSEQEVLVLELLTKSPSMSVGDLQRAIGVSTTKMSRILRRLEREAAEALVQCALNADDRRKYDVSITEAGREAHRAYRTTKLSSIIRVLAEMPEVDRSEFVRLLNSIRERLLQEYASRLV